MSSMQDRKNRSMALRTGQVRAAAMAHARGCANDFKSIAFVKAGIREAELDSEIAEGVAEYFAKKGS